MMGHPVVRERVESDALVLTGMYYDLETARVHLLDAGTSTFMPVTSAQGLPLQRVRADGEDTDGQFVEVSSSGVSSRPSC